MNATIRARASTVFGVAAWFALSFGLLEGPGLLFSFYSAPLPSALGRGVSADMLWFAPLFDMVLFLGVACVLWAGLRIARRLPEEDASFIVFSFMTFLGLLMLPVTLHKAAELSLAGGLTAALARWARPRRQAVAWFMRKSLPALAVAYLLVAAAVVGGGYLREAAAVRSLPNPPSGPNVLLIVVDTLRADRTSVHGYARPTTPGLEKFAAEGTSFTSAFATSSWTLPSHASMFTGLYPDEHQTHTSPLSEQFPTLAETLRQRGYLTGAFVANTWYCHRGTGLARGFIRFEDFFGSPSEAVSRTVYGSRIARRVADQLGYHDSLGRKSVTQISDSFLGWLDSYSGRPFFAFLNLMDVHDPYLPPLDYAARFSAQPEALVSRVPVNQNIYVSGSITAEQMQLERDAYDAAVAYLDARLTDLMQELERRGVLNKTLVIITSDHGEALFEHGLLGHEQSLYREMLHIPLLVRLPGVVPAGVRDDRIASLADLPATITTAVGGDSQWPGQDLLADPASASGSVFAQLRRNPWGPTHWPNHDGWLQSVITTRWQFIRHERGTTELYDWKNDPDELNNLAGTPEGAPLVVAFMQQLDARSGNLTGAQTGQD